MPRIALDLTKTLEENAADYFEKAKKAKKKIEGAEVALSESIKKLEQLKSKKARTESLKGASGRKKEWYEKFRWFISSEGFLVIGGRDATSNEVVIKKHTDANDLVFHTDMAGSPFFVIKAENKKVGDKTIQETADATCTFSRVWKLGLQSSPVFYVSPEQVSKKTKSGEFMSKGAFMIYGKTNYIDNKVNLSVGMTKSMQIMAAPMESVKAHCSKYIALLQGNEKASAVAKYIRHHLGGELDEIIRSLPSGSFKVKK